MRSGPVQRTDLAQWDLTVQGLVGNPARWSWEEFSALPHDDLTVDLHCVTAWSKLDTRWRGVPVDLLIADAAPAGDYVTAF